MRVYAIKHCGKVWRGTMIFNKSFIGNEEIYRGEFFVRKKDAKLFLEFIGMEDLYEVVGMTIDNCGKDMRKN